MKKLLLLTVTLGSVVALPQSPPLDLVPQRRLSKLNNMR
jgi:hypothetical protein